MSSTVVASNYMIFSRIKQMVVTLWEDMALQFQEALHPVGHRPVFVVITGLIAKKFSDAPTLSSSDATKSFINIDYTPLNKLRDALLTAMGKPIDLLPPLVLAQIAATEGNTVRELTIASILEITIPHGKEVICCLCRGTIVEILTGNGWYYNCCPKCARTVRPLEGKYRCATCLEPAEPISQRYRVVIRIEDDSGTTTLTLFNKEAEQLMGVPLPTVLASLGKDETIENIPPPLNNIIGKVCLFQIKVTPYNINHGCEEYTVQRVSEILFAVSPPTADPSSTLPASSKDATDDDLAANNPKRQKKA